MPQRDFSKLCCLQTLNNQTSSVYSEFACADGFSANYACTKLFSFRFRNYNIGVHSIVFDYIKQTFIIVYYVMLRTEQYRRSFVTSFTEKWNYLPG